MSRPGILRRHPVLGWLVPGGAVVVAAVALTGVLGARAATSLPPRTAAELVADVQAAHTAGFSGTVVAKASLGLPDLSGLADDAGDASLLALLSGSHTLRVWYAGPTKQRVAVLETIGENDVFHDGRDLWQWDSDSHVATHTLLAADGAGAGTPEQFTPQQLAADVLGRVTPTTDLSVASPVRVAGRDAYRLVLRPTDAASRIASVDVSIDGASKIPLGVQVYARDDTSTPALDVEFTDFGTGTPDDEHFVFRPAAGVRVQEAAPGSDAAGALPDVRTYGAGWTTVAVVRTDRTAGSAGADAFTGMMSALTPVHGTWGTGRLFTSSLFSALLCTDGRLIAGPVDADALYTAAAGTR